MKGDLDTLRKVCRYASKVMLAGEIVLAAVVAITVIVGIGSLLSDSLADAVASWSEAVYGVPEVGATRFAETLFILVLGTVTVDAVRRLMETYRGSHSPFDESNADLVKGLSVLYLASSVVLLVLEVLSGGSVSECLFYFLGTLLICVVLYCLSIVFRYGSVLQNESDHTL